MTDEPTDEPADATTDSDDTDEFEDGAAYEGGYRVAPPTPRTYDGWHHPRKQVVRDVQWARPLQEVLGDRQEAPTKLSYLGLPGRDMLDVRHFLSTICEPANLRLEFLGFDRAAQPDDEANAQLNSAYADIMRSPLTDGVIRSDDINRIAVHGTASYLEATRRAPYDVINLDFCEPVLIGAKPTYALLDRLFLLQRTTNDWLLLLTSFVDAQSSNDASLQPLLSLLEDDLATCEGLEDVIAELLDLPEPLTPSQARDLSPTAFFLLTSMLAGTWIFREAMRRGFRVKVVSVAGYAVNAEPPNMDMMSLSLRLQPDFTTTGDEAGLVSADSADPCERKKAIFKKMGSIDNVDTYFSDDQRQRHYIGASIELIRQSNHPVGLYEAFLRSKGIDPTA